MNGVANGKNLVFTTEMPNKFRVICCAYNDAMLRQQSLMYALLLGEVKSPQPQSPMHQPQAQGSTRPQPTLSPHSQARINDAS